MAMMDWGPMMTMMNGWMGAWMWFAPVVLVLLVVLTAVAVARGPRTVVSRGDEPRAILARRLANGEITKEQFEQLKKTLADA